MAKQTGTIKLTGTIDDLCFYEMEGNYYVRLKSSLSGKRYQKDAAFAGSRRSASRFGEGNRLASAVYRLIDKEMRVYSLFCFLKRKSILLLKEGKSLREAEAILKDYLLAFGYLQMEKPKGIAEMKADSSKSQIGSRTGCLIAPARVISILKKMPGFTMLHLPPFLPVSRFVSPAAGRFSFPFPLRDRIFWRSPPRSGHQVATVGGPVPLRQVDGRRTGSNAFATKKNF